MWKTNHIYKHNKDSAFFSSVQAFLKMHEIAIGFGGFLALHNLSFFPGSGECRQAAGHIRGW